MQYKRGWGGFGKFDMWGCLARFDSRGGVGVLALCSYGVAELRCVSECRCVGVETPFTHPKN